MDVNRTFGNDFEYIVGWEVVRMVTCECGVLEAWIELFCVHVSGDGYWVAIIEKFLRVDQVLFWLKDDLYVQK